MTEDAAKTLELGAPWFTGDARAWLNANLKPHDHVFEIGGGRSTVFFLSRCASVRTLEASPTWASALVDHMVRRPALMRGWSLDFVPCDWQPTWRTRASGYWDENDGALDLPSAKALELKYLRQAMNPVSANVLCIDGGLRSHLMVLSTHHDLFGSFDLVVIDNAERPFTSWWLHRNPPPGFARHDFIVGEFDTKLMPVQEGKHITTILVRDDRQTADPAPILENQTSWTEEQLIPHQLPMKDDEDQDRNARWAAFIEKELREYELI